MSELLKVEVEMMEVKPVELENNEKKNLGSSNLRIGV